MKGDVADKSTPVSAQTQENRVGEEINRLAQGEPGHCSEHGERNDGPPHRCPIAPIRTATRSAIGALLPSRYRDQGF
jgi:hypothetical protein